MTAGGKAHDANSVRVDIQIRRMSTHPPDRALTVMHRDRVMIPLGGQAILQDKANNSVLGKPIGLDAAFVIKWRAHRKRHRDK